MMKAIGAFFKRRWNKFILDVKGEFAGETFSSLLKNNLMVVFGAFIYSIGAAFFLLPMNIISGGISSMAIILNAVPGLGILSVDTYIIILTWAFFILGFLILGVKYSIKTLVFSIFNPLFILLFNYLIEVAVIDGIHIFDITHLMDITLANSTVISSEQLLPIAYLVSGILGGIIMGAGIGFALLGGGSSGGTDVINLTVNKYFHIKVGTCSLCCDIIIIACGFYINGMNLLASSVGIITSFLCSVLIDMVFQGKNKSYIAFIVSKEWVKINDFITSNIERGTTLYRAQGGFSRLDTMVIQVCFDRSEYSLLERGIHKIDHSAFITIVKASEIVGYGFSKKVKDGIENVPLSSIDAERLVLKSRRKNR